MSPARDQEMWWGICVITVCCGMLMFGLYTVFLSLGRRFDEGTAAGIKTGRCVELCLPAGIETEVKDGCICTGSNEVKRLRPLKGRP